MSGKKKAEALQIPIVDPAQLQKAEAALKDQAEMKRQHSHLTSFLKQSKQKEAYDAHEPAWRKEFFRGFVAKRFTELAEKSFETTHKLRTAKASGKQYEMMNEERMIKKKGENWTKEKLEATARGDTENGLEIDPKTKDKSRWTIKYKVYTDCHSIL